jgi:hypothetical protein
MIIALRIFGFMGRGFWESSDFDERKKSPMVGALRAAIFSGLVLTGVLATPAQAALVSCPASFTVDGTAKVHDGTLSMLTAASACEYDNATGQSDVASLSQINTSAFFGFNDWVDNGQTQIVPGSGQSGSWSILNVDFAAMDYLMVFKDGDDTSLIAFSFNELFSSGGWSSPFTEPPFDFQNNNTIKDVSHYSIFARSNPDGGPGPGPGPVPEPPAMPIFLGGLAAFLMVLRRRYKAEGLARQARL